MSIGSIGMFDLFDFSFGRLDVSTDYLKGKLSKNGRLAGICQNQARTHLIDIIDMVGLTSLEA